MTMLKLSARNIRASVGRLVLTILAVTAGVGFVTGSFILADSLSDTFSGIFESAASQTDASVQLAGLEFGEDDQTLSDSVVAALEELPETARVTPIVTITDQFTPFVILDAAGEEVKPRGPPILTFSWDGREVESAIALAEGRSPAALDEVVINTEYAVAADVAVGDQVNFLTPDGQQTFTLVGTVDFPVSAGAFFVLFDFESAQTLYGKEGLVDTVELAAAPGVSAEELIAAAERVVPSEAEVINQAEVIEQSLEDFNQFIGIFRNVLLAFAGIALFVSLFIIYNTFAILVNQRIQQIGMLRAIGATGRQIRFSILAEAALVGLIGAVLGLAAGFGVAFLIKAAFQAAGGFPETGNVITTTTVLVAFLVGVGATVLSALGPAFLASRVSPVAAMRNEAGGDRGQHRRIIGGLVCLAVGLVLLGLGLFLGGQQTSVLLIELAVGAILTFVGVALLSVLFAGPIVNFIGRAEVLGTSLLVLGASLLVFMFTVGDGLPDGVVSWVTFPIKVAVSTIAILTGLSILISKSRGSGFGLGGSAAGLEGQLAKRNAGRSPQRTAATATALTIGVALVATVGTVGESLKASFTDSLERGVQADLFIYDEEGQGSFSGDLADRLEGVAGLAELSRFRANELRLADGDVVNMFAYETGTGESVIDLGIVAGSLEGTADNGMLVFVDEAEERGLLVGDSLVVDFPDLQSETLTVVGLFEDNSVLGVPFIIDLDLYEQHISNDDDVFVGAAIEEGTSVESVKAAVVAVTAEFSGVTAQDNEEFLNAQEGQIDGLITLINFMLGFALFTAFLGVVNTIVLSVVERTREIGLLRAVGTTRAQMRAVIRWEAVIVCLFGALVGIVLGVLFAWAAVTAIPDGIISRMALPYETVIFAILVAALAGVVAAALPARRAARLNVLDAISTS